jgi:hypothetical protein
MIQIGWLLLTLIAIFIYSQGDNATVCGVENIFGILTSLQSCYFKISGNGWD